MKCAQLMYSSNLDDPIPHLPVETRSAMCLTTVSGTRSVGDMLHDRLVEPLPPPPLSQAAGIVDFDRAFSMFILFKYYWLRTIFICN